MNNVQIIFCFFFKIIKNCQYSLTTDLNGTPYEPFLIEQCPLEYIRVAEGDLSTRVCGGEACQGIKG